MTTTMDHHALETTGQGVQVLFRVMLLIGDQSYALGDAEIACDTPAVRAWLAQAPLPTLSEMATSLPPALVNTELRQHLSTLCRRLGVDEPVYSQLGTHEAVSLLARLQAEEEELLRTAALARAVPSSEQNDPRIEKALVRQLKARWRARVRPQGSVEDLLHDWEGFKQRVCGKEIADRTMHADHYEQLLAALASPDAERTRR